MNEWIPIQVPNRRTRLLMAVLRVRYPRRWWVQRGTYIYVLRWPPAAAKEAT